MYDAPPECLDEKDAFSLVHRRSRRVERGSGDGPLQRLDVTIVETASGYRGVLTVTRPGQSAERRSMVGAGCDEVVEALALTAALSIDPNATLTLGPASRESEHTAGESATEAEPATSEAPARPIESDEKPAPAPIHTTLGASLTVQSIMQDAVHLGGGATLSIARQDRKTWFPLEARLSLSYLTEAPNQNEEDVFTRVVLSRLVYCPIRAGGDLTLLLCPAFQAGALLADSRGFEEGEHIARWYATLGLDAWLRARISRHWELWLSPRLAFPLTERRFAVEPGPEVVTATTLVSWGVSSGVGWVF